MSLVINKLHSEKLFEEISFRQTQKNPSLLIQYFNACLARGYARFSKEILKDRIFDNLDEILAKYRNIIPSYFMKEFSDDYKKVQFSITPEQMFFTDAIVAEATMIISVYVNSPRKDYYIAKEFWKDFSSLTIDKLRFSDLPIGVGYAFLPLPIVDDEGTEYHHLYFASGKIEDLFNCRWHGGGPDREIISDEILTYTLIADSGVRRTFRVQLPKDKNIEIKNYLTEFSDVRTYINFSLEEIPSTYDKSRDLQQALNLLCYIASGQPDISTYRNPVEYRGHSRQPVNRHRHLSLRPIELVGYNWKKLPKYSENEWSVKPHLRWQRFGVGLSKVKIITVRGHLRRRRTHPNDPCVTM